MTFFNQPRMSCDGVQIGSPAGFGAGFRFALDQLPPSIDRLVFVAVIDGAGTMRFMASHYTHLCKSLIFIEHDPACVS
jgi:stress response protein SCP2